MKLGRGYILKESVLAEVVNGQPRHPIKQPVGHVVYCSAGGR
jgi:hypothetical protein